MTTRKFAQDDANLNTGSVITSRDRKYRDINLLFQPKPGTGDVYISKDAAAVKQAVKNLLLTNFYERPFQPNLGSGIRDSLFEMNDSFARLELEDDIRRVIRNYEPRAKINKLKIMSDGGQGIRITLEFRVITLQETVVLDLVIERLR